MKCKSNRSLAFISVLLILTTLIGCATTNWQKIDLDWITPTGQNVEQLPPTIYYVYPNTYGYRAGLKKGDKLIRSGSRPINSAWDYGEILLATRQDTCVPLTVLRGGKTLNFTVEKPRNFIHLGLKVLPDDVCLNILNDDGTHRYAQIISGNVLIQAFAATAKNHPDLLLLIFYMENHKQQVLLGPDDVRVSSGPWQMSLLSPGQVVDEILPAVSPGGHPLPFAPPSPPTYVGRTTGHIRGHTTYSGYSSTTTGTFTGTTTYTPSQNTGVAEVYNAFALAYNVYSTIKTASAQKQARERQKCYQWLQAAYLKPMRFEPSQYGAGILVFKGLTNIANSEPIQASLKVGHQWFTFGFSGSTKSVASIKGGTQKRYENPKTTRDPVTVSEVSSSEDYKNSIELIDFRITGNNICGMIRNKGDRTVEYLVIEADCLNSGGKIVQKKWYQVVPYGKSKKSLKAGGIISIKAGDHKISSSATHVQVNLHELR